MKQNFKPSFIPQSDDLEDEWDLEKDEWGLEKDEWGMEEKEGIFI